MELKGRRNNNAFNYLTALSNFPDQLFNFRNNDLPQSLSNPRLPAKEDSQTVGVKDLPIRNFLEAVLAGCKFPQATDSFLHIIAGERQALSTNLCRSIMSQFQERYTDEETKTFKYASPKQTSSLLEKYTQHGWMDPDFYNTMINTLSSKFDRMSPQEISQVVYSFGQVGIYQPDVISKTVSRLQTLAKGEDKKAPYIAKGWFS